MPGFASSNSNNIDCVFAKNADFSGSGEPNDTNGLQTDGQLWIGHTDPAPGALHIKVGKITSPNNTIVIGYDTPNITIDVKGGQAIDRIYGDVGFISGQNVTIFANQATLNCGSSVFFNNSGTISTMHVTDSGFNTVIGLGSGSANLSTMGGNNVVLGASALSDISGTATNCIAIGNAALISASVGSSVNVAIGNGALSSGTSVTACIAIGQNTGSLLLTGSDCILIGNNSGNSYVAAESNNVLINHVGVAGENGVMRFGTPTFQNAVFVSGITGVAVPGSSVVGVTSSGQLTDLGFGTVTQVLTSNGAGNSPTFQNSNIVRTTIPGAYPYTVLSSDAVILADSSAAHGITLEALPATGTIHRIKDATGTAAAFNITITPAIGTIDGAATKVINNNFGSVDLIYSGTQWLSL